jgi:hypothetical protein
MASKRRIFKVRGDGRALFFCILTASTFWIFNAMNREYTDEIYYPLEIKFDESRVIPVSQHPKKLKINVTGFGWDLLRNRLGVVNEPVILQLKDLPDRKYVSASEITPYIAAHLKELKLNKLVVDTIRLDFDYRKIKKVKVWIDSVAIALAPYYKISSPIIITPDSISIEGPSGYINKIADSIKVNITKSGIKEKFEENVKVVIHTHYSVKVLNKEMKVRFDVGKFESQSLTVPLQKSDFPP